MEKIMNRNALVLWLDEIRMNGGSDLEILGSKQPLIKEARGEILLIICRGRILVQVIVEHGSCSEKGDILLGPSMQASMSTSNKKPLLSEYMDMEVGLVVVERYETIVPDSGDRFLNKKLRVVILEIEEEYLLSVPLAQTGNQYAWTDSRTLSSMLEDCNNYLRDALLQYLIL